MFRRNSCGTTCRAFAVVSRFTIVEINEEWMSGWFYAAFCGGALREKRDVFNQIFDCLILRLISAYEFESMILSA